MLRLWVDFNLRAGHWLRFSRDSKLHEFGAWKYKVSLDDRVAPANSILSSVLPMNSISTFAARFLDSSHTSGMNFANVAFSERIVLLLLR